MPSRSGGRAVAFRLISTRVFLRDCVTRLPFRFGVVTMYGAPLCVLRVEAEFEDGRVTGGYASDLLVPKWFEKTPGQTVAQDWRRLTDTIRATCDAAVAGAARQTAFEHWRALDDARVMSWRGDRSARLVLGQGVSLVERAMIDAVCRRLGMPFHETLRAGASGFDSARFGLTTPLEAVVRAEPRPRMHLRHTVGLADAILESDAADIDPGDGLPASLEAAIAAGGLTHFKLKVSGDIDADLDRLAHIARLLRERSGDATLCTLDGNEQFASIAALGELLARLDERDDTAWLRIRIAYVEQPMSRARTLDPAAAAGLGDLGLPVIIDEADVDREVFAEAAALGYRGVSVKNCKGVFRAIAAAIRCHDSGGRLFQSAEDLTNIPAVALHQDLATSASVGLSHIERNGHHYFPGLSHLDPAERDALLAAHPDLYRPGGIGGGGLRIERGGISIASLHAAAGYGYAGAPDLSGWTPVESWSPDGLVARIAQAGGSA